LKTNSFSTKAKKEEECNRKTQVQESQR